MERKREREREIKQDRERERKRRQELGSSARMALMHNICLLLQRVCTSRSVRIAVPKNRHTVFMPRSRSEDHISNKWEGFNLVHSFLWQRLIILLPAKGNQQIKVLLVSLIYCTHCLTEEKLVFVSLNYDLWTSIYSPECPISPVRQQGYYYCWVSLFFLVNFLFFLLSKVVFCIFLDKILKIYIYIYHTFMQRLINCT